MSEQKTIRPRDKGDVPDDPLSRMRHSASHVMADAVKRLRPNAKVAIGPSIETGFYYDFDTEPFGPEDVARIEDEMRKIIAENVPFIRHVVTRAEALERFRSRGEKYKVEIIESIPEGDEVSYFQHGDFIDLCRGPHVERTGDIKAFKVLSFAGAYWRGDERNAQLQRVYGTAFPSQADLDAYLKQIEEAKRRDHRTLGKELDLFSFDELVGPGFALWHPKGAFVRYQIEDIIRRENVRRGYELVYTPHLAREQLLETSGPPGSLQGQPLRRDGAGRPALPRQADELPVPHRHLPVADAVVPRPAAPLLGARDRLSLRAVGRACTASCASAA